MRLYSFGKKSMIARFFKVYLVWVIYSLNICYDAALGYHPLKQLVYNL